jgi:hypothetical protein
LRTASCAAGICGALPHGDHALPTLRVRLTLLAQEAMDLTRHRIGVAAEQAFPAGQFDQRRASDVAGQVAALGQREGTVRPAV